MPAAATTGDAQSRAQARTWERERERESELTTKAPPGGNAMPAPATTGDVQVNDLIGKAVGTD